MKKIIFFSVLSVAISFSACKKEEKTITVTNTERDTTYLYATAAIPLSADSITSLITVGYGTKVSGTFPESTTDAETPTMDTMFKNKTYQVIPTNYLTIYPSNYSGEVAGYYVQIEGASAYFKIDYATATGRGNGTGYIDSTILIHIPVALAGDTFKVKYAAYDAENRVSLSITSKVIVLPVASDALVDSLTGSWYYYAESYVYTDGNEYTQGQYNSDSISTSYQYYTCDGSTLTVSNTATNYLVPYYIYSTSQGYRFGAGYSAWYLYTNTEKILDTDNSSCSNYVYTSTLSDNSYKMGGYSYDQATRNLTIIYSTESQVGLSYSTFKIEKLTATQLVLKSADNSGDDYNVHYQYYNKR